MSYQDFSQVSETLIIQIKKFFIDPNVAKTVLGLSTFVLMLCSYNLVSLYVSYKDWVAIDVNILHRVVLPEQNLPTIGKKHLFGQVIRPGATLSDARKTMLPLKLKGIIYDLDPKLGAAIILGADGVEKSYHVGERLPIKGSNITLEYIFKDKVFIKNNDALEFIEYPKLELKNQPGSKNSINIRNSAPGQFLPSIEPIDNSPINTEIEDENNNNNNNNVEDLDSEAVMDKLSRASGSKLGPVKFRKKGKTNFN
jgi:type II secretory pathway component PulC